jgi:hypothetical protein
MTDQSASDPNTEVITDALIVTDAQKAAVTIIDDEKPSLFKVVKTFLKIGIPVLVAMFVFFNFWNFLDLASPRTIEVRSYGWSTPSEGNSTKIAMADELLLNHDLFLTALVADGTSITGRIDQSWPRYFVQRKDTYGNLKSSSALAEEQGCRKIRLEVSGVHISMPFLKRYVVVKDVKVSPQCNAKQITN